MGLTERVLAKIDELGQAEAAIYFGVSVGTVNNWKYGRSKPSIGAAEKILNNSVAQDMDEVEDDLTMWEGRKLMILLPTYRTIHPKTHFTLFANYAKYGPEKIGLMPQERTCIWEARNILIDRAMKTDAPYFLFGDDDMVPPCGSEALFNGKYRAGVRPDQARLNAISRIMSHGPDKEIIGGLYFGRHEYGRAQCELGFSSDDENRKLRRGEYQGAIPMRWVGTGWLRIARTAIEKMREAIEGGKWPEAMRRSEKLHYGYFNPIRVSMGEDISFANRAAEIGIQSYCDTSLVLLHADGGTLYGPRNVTDRPPK